MIRLFLLVCVVLELCGWGARSCMRPLGRTELTNTQFAWVALVIAGWAAAITITMAVMRGGMGWW